MYRLNIYSKLIIIFILWSLSIEAQPDKIFSPSPTVSSLMKFVNVPVNLYTGIPDINIPIFEAKSRSLSIPISLSYHASGIRIDEVCGWVGTNWSLNAGGVISRTIYGKGDEIQSIGYMHVFNRLLKNIDPIRQLTFDQKMTIYQGLIDAEPDQFAFYSGKISGKFLIDPLTHKAYTIPFSPVKISYNSGFSEWEITSEDGTRYIFGKSSDKRVATETIDMENVCGDASNVDLNQNTSWFLMEMISAGNGDTIKFYYENDYISYATGKSFSTSIPFSDDDRCETQSFSSCISLISYFSKRISKISTASNIIYFRAETYRDDVDDSRMLDSISIYTNDNVFVRKFIFDYGYYISEKRLSQNSYFNSISNNLKRLRLDKITEYYDENNKKPPYQLIYNQTELPPRGSYAQDHWGFYNGKTNNSSPIPSFELKNYKYTGADREADTETCKAGILTSIIYPTGGSVNFEYESNSFGHEPLNYINEQETIPIKIHKSLNYIQGASNTYLNNFEIDFEQEISLKIEISNTKFLEGEGECIILDKNGKTIKFLRGSIGTNSSISNPYLKKGTYTLKLTANSNGDRITCEVKLKKYTGILIKNKYGGGLRLRSIQYNDGLHLNNCMIKKYIYSRFSEPDRSSGCLISDFPKYNYSYAKPIVSVNMTTGVPLPSSGGLFCHYEKYTSNPMSQISTTNGSFVGYSEVTEIVGEKGENGKIQYKFTSPIEFKSFGDRGYPFTPTTSYDYARGKPLSIFVYNNSGILRSKETNTYFFDKVNNYHEIIGLRIGATKTAPEMEPEYWTFIIEQFKVISQWIYLQTNTREEYDNEGKNPVIYKTEFIYSNPTHAQVTKSRELKSDGSVIIKKFTYPFDYPSDSLDIFSDALRKMQKKNIINPVIESITSIQKPNETEKAVSGKFTKFKEFSKDQILPFQNYALDILAPLNDFRPSSIQVLSNRNQLNIDSRYRLEESFLTYDDYENLTFYQKNKDLPVSIIWGYNKCLPIAKILNSNPFQSAYNGFETFEKNGWEFNLNDIVESKDAIVGRKMLELSTQLIRRNIPAGNYHLTFWGKDDLVPNITSNVKMNLKTDQSQPNEQQWKLYIYEIKFETDGDLLIDPGITIDEIRLYPENALMISYSYIPNYGIYSINDENNISKFYEYDKLGRLIKTKDFDKNILEFYQYHLKQ